MKICFTIVFSSLLVAAGAISQAAAAPAMQSVNPRDGSIMPAASGGGDSMTPLITPDGRFVLFVSTANNLVTLGTNQPMPLHAPPRLNVFLRDRLNQTTVLVSANADGSGGGDGDSQAVAISTNGLYALFESTASDIVAGDTNNVSDIFLRNLATGTTILVSAATNGAVGDGVSEDATMTPDGRYVAFSSAARNLVPGDTNTIADIFVRDTQAGSTLLASVGAQPIKGAYSVTNASINPLITPDGRYVVFMSTASNLVAGVTNLADIYLRDLLGGKTYWASSYALTALKAVNSATTAGICDSPVVSADGQYVAYEASRTPFGYPWPSAVVLRYSVATGLTDLLSTNATVQNGDYAGATLLDISADGRLVAFVSNTNGSSGGTTCIYLWDAQTGTATLASGDLTNSVPTNSTCCTPILDPQGHWLAFLSSAQTLVTNTLSGTSHLFLRDLDSSTIRLLDGDTNGNGAGVPYYDVPALSGDARFAAFESVSYSLVPGDGNRLADVFVRDLVYGTNELISVRAPQLPTVTGNGLSSVSYQPISADGARIVFSSDADDLAPNDTNRLRDVFVRDMNAASNILVSVNTNGVSANFASLEGAISANGRYVAFTSRASDLLPGDTNNLPDVFVRDLESQSTTLVSVNTNGTASGDGESYAPLISGTGRFVAYRSKAKNLAAGVITGENIYVRDLLLQTNYALFLSGQSAQDFKITPDGRFIAFAGANSLSVWSTDVGGVVFTTNISKVLGGIGISPDGSRVAFNVNSNLFVCDISTGSNYLVAATATTTHPGLRFSADGRWMTCALAAHTTVIRTNQVYLYDVVGGTNLLVSRAYDGAEPGNSSSDWPEISPNGRFIAYRSRADNLVPGDTNGRGDVFLYDRQSGTTSLLSASNAGSGAGDNMSLFPVFSDDGSTLLFESWASDLVSHDFNQTLNVLAYSLFASGEIPVFSARAVSTGSPTQSPTLNWPVIAGKSYRVQFKNSVTDASWQEVGGGVTILGNQGYFLDPSSSAGPRFYRVVAY